MEPAKVLLVVFVALTIVFASISAYEYASVLDLGSRSHSSSSSNPTTSLLGEKGRLVIQGVGTFDYLHRNGSTPDQLTFDNVKFTLWTNTTVTYTGGPCYVGNYYGGYVASFSDGSSDRFVACLVGPYPYTQLLFTKHTNSQAGLLISGTNGDIYFLVSA